MNWLRRLLRFLQPPTPPTVPAPLDDDEQFERDMRYLKIIASAIFAECALNADEAPDVFPDWVAQPLLQMLAIPVAPDTQPDWPDHAAMLLRYWESERELQRMVDELEREAA